jgi:hypothetical protein
MFLVHPHFLAFGLAGILCYTLIMQSIFWPDWAKILEQWGLTSLACIVLDRARPLLLILSQFLLLGLPLLKGLSMGAHVSALAETLGHEESLVRFSAYLQEEQV